jgi:hypothetical protein
MFEPYTITYSNHFKVDNKTFAFRKKLLFDVTETPSYKPMLNNNGSIGVWINRKWISISVMKKLIINEPITVDISHLQMYQQCHLEECFNLKQ